MRAAVFGGTGQVGRRLIVELLKSSKFSGGVISLSRSRLYPLELSVFDSNLDMENLTQHRLGKLPSVDQIERESVHLIRGCTHAFCTLGVGIKRLQTKENLEHVDVQLAAAFARACKHTNTVGHFSLLSAAGADPNASEPWARAKGEIEELVFDVGFPTVSMFRPNTILGSIHTPQSTQRWMPWVSKVLPNCYKATEVGELAHAMCRVAEGVHVEIEEDANRMQRRWGSDEGQANAMVNVTLEEGLPAEALDVLEWGDVLRLGLNT